ncbi:MAG: DNA polymerase subunit beta, partial [Candidatus Hydrothermarchaeales archaeon]
PLGEKEWRRYYRKRFPAQSPFGFETFLWHEKRKFNIGMIEGTLFNLLLVGDEIKLRKAAPLKRTKIRCMVEDAKQAFNLPSLYVVDHELVEEVISFTHTYAGQAKEGEEIEVAGMLEKMQKGYRVVVGTTREPEDEYIKVIGH